MNPDGTLDVNLRSFLGPQDNGRTISEPGTTCGYVPDPSVPAKPAYTAPLKFTSQVNGIVAQFGTVIGGSENAADCNNAAYNLSLRAEVWDISRTKYGFTNKGGCQGNHFGGVVRGHGSEVDFDQDDWSDQSHVPVAGTELNFHSEDGSPLLVRYIYNKPTLLPGSGPYKFAFPWPWLPFRVAIGKIFNQLRRMKFPGTT
jgi:hypothetical protein